MTSGIYLDEPLDEKGTIDMTEKEQRYKTKESQNAPENNVEEVSEEISEKVGNYVLTFGKTTSGKSAMQQHLLRWLMEKDENITSYFDPVDDTWSSHALYNEWKDMWEEGRFPTRTDARTPINEFRISVKPKVKPQNVLTFSFLEIAGELFHDVIARNNKPPSLPLNVSEYLDNEAIKFCIILVSDGTAPVGKASRTGEMIKDDQLFCNFMSYLRVAYDGRFEGVPILLVVTKWDQVLLKNTKIKNGFTIIDYMDKYLPGTKKIMEGMPSGMAQYTEFSVGAVSTKTYDDGKERDYIRKANFEDVKVLSDWLYRVFSGRNKTKPKSKFWKVARVLLGGK